MEDKKITVIGLGLIGGSLVRALRERLKVKDITAVNRSRQAIDQALADGSITRGFTSIDPAVYESDIIFLCTPVGLIPEYINSMSGKLGKNCVVTDVGSTKADIVKYVDGLGSQFCFIGGHPMAGTEKTGYGSGYAHLFENAYYILTPGKASTPEALKTMEELVKGIGAIPVVMEPDEHDRVTGGISHVPHIVASALVNLVRSMETPDSKMKRLAAGGFRDITRIASSSPEMWENIIFSNRDKVVTILDSFTDIIDEFREHVKNSDSGKVVNFFETARAYRDSLSQKPGMIGTTWDLAVDVVDKPGIIGNIATLLGESGINIKNINVSNNREFEQGCLRITLPDAESLEAAYLLLTKEGYKVYKSR